MSDQFQVISSVTKEVKLAFDREGITIPFPIRTLHLLEDGEKSTGTLRVNTNGTHNSNGNRDDQSTGSREKAT